MSNTESTHLECPYVDCGSSDAFAYNTQKKCGKCHSCNRSYPSKDEMFPWAKERYPVVEKSAFFSDDDDKDYGYEEREFQKGNKKESEGRIVTHRSITKETMEFYNVKYYENVEWKAKYRGEYHSGVADEFRFPYPSGANKLRRTSLEKDHFAHFSFSGGSADHLFGMNLFTAGSSRKVTITEGEWDALSVYQMLKSQYINPVVSLPSSTPSKKFWENVKPWLDSFDQIILSVDNDERGNAVAAKIAQMFPNKVYRVDHSKYKDANDFLRDGAQQEFKSAWFNAKKYIPENILNTSDQFLELLHDSPNHQYVPTGIQGLDDKILGLMQGHFTMFKAPTGIGKTELMRKLEYTMLQEGIPIASWHLEETKLRSLLGLVSYELNDNLTRKDLIEEKGRLKDVEEAIKKLTKDELFYQFYLPEGSGADELIEQIRYFVTVCGVKYVFFEPIQDVISGLTDESKEAALADLSVRLSKLAADLNVGIVSIGHTNENGDFKYCKMIGQRASVIVDLYRDKHADDHNDRNTTLLTIEKNRPTGEEGAAGKLKFNPVTFTLREMF